MFTTVSRFLFQFTLSLLVIAGSLEGIARIDPIGALLPASTVGPDHPNFDVKFTRFNRMVTHFNCLIVGDSMPSRGLDPEIIHQIHFEETNTPLRCFNFSLSGMSSNDISELVMLLNDEHKFDTVIWAITLGQINENTSEPFILSSEWSKYHRGGFSMEGFLVSHSQSYRYFYGMVRALLFPLEEKDPLEYNLLPNGQNITPLHYEDLTDDVLRSIERRLLASAKPECPRLHELDRMTQLTAEGTDVFFVEMPIHITSSRQFPQLLQDYTQVSLELEQYVQGQLELPFIAANESITNALADYEYWKDPSHLNQWGAEIFSTWVAEQIVEHRHGPQRDSLAPPVDWLFLKDCV